MKFLQGFAAWFLAAFMQTGFVQADVPTLEHLYPAGGVKGSSNLVSVTGKFESWPPRVWCSDPLLVFHPDTNKGKIVISVPPEAQAGPKLIRLYNDEGASELRPWVVGNSREISDSETNNHFLKPQAVPFLPVTINGRLDKSGDVDSFAIDLGAGEYLDATVDAFSLASKLDAVLRLVTTNGVQLAWNHDFISLDPRLRWEARSNQAVVLQVFGFPHPANAEVKLFGGDGAVYRLHLEKGTGGIPPLLEDPQNPSEKIKPPTRLAGCIESGEKEHRYAFDSEKNQHWEAEVEAAGLGSPLDAWLKIEDETGKELKRNDDAEGSRDPSLDWKAPERGTYRLAVGSVTHRGGKDYRYAIHLREAAPEARLHLISGNLVAAPGSTNQIKFNLKRLRDHTNEIRVEARGIPHGVKLSPTNAPLKSGEFSIPLVVDFETTNSQGQIRFVMIESGKQDRPIYFKLSGRTEDNGVPGGFTHLLVDEIDHLWLTIYRKKEEKKSEEKKKE